MKVKNYDLIYIHLWGTPYGLPIFEKLLSLFCKKLIYDIDDLIFLRNTSDANSTFKKLKSSGKAHFLMKNADHVITCTPVLDDYVKKYNKNTSDISSTVDTENKYLFNTNRYTPKNKVIIGWTGSHSTSKYLYLLATVLKKLTKEFDFKLIVMGDRSFHIDEVHIEAMDWCEGFEMEVLNTFDIGLYPLPDEPWIYGKSGLKAIQYQALGIPVVASKLGTNTRVIKDNETGFLVQWDSIHEWYTKIKLFIENSELRQKMGIQGRKHIEENYSVSSTKQVYLEVLNKVLSS